MITWNAGKQKFTWTDRSNFLPDTRIQVQEFQHHITQPYPFNLPSNASPMDQYVSTKPITSKRVPSGTNLCHHISIGAIQEVTCAYLNGEISIWVFMNFVGNVATPTWLTLLDKNSSGIVLKEWAYSFVNKISIAVNTKLSNKTPQEIANMANDFVRNLTICMLICVTVIQRQISLLATILTLGLHVVLPLIPSPGSSMFGAIA
jgi:hypothetical protein